MIWVRSHVVPSTMNDMIPALGTLVDMREISNPNLPMVERKR